MCKKFISAIVMMVFSSVFADAEITSIKEVLNETDEVVEVKLWAVSPSDKETTGEIPANGGIWSGNMWIPWMDNADDFSNRLIEIKIDKKTVFLIWQSGGYVRYKNSDRRVFLQNISWAPGE